MPSVKQAKAKMEEALNAMRREFSTVRTGKATPALGKRLLDLKIAAAVREIRQKLAAGP